MNDERRYADERNLVWVGLIALVLCLFVALTTGCAKKAALKEGAAITPETTVTRAPDENVASADREAREKAVQEQALRDKAAREKAEQEAAERAKREAEVQAAAIFKELQIPDIRFDFDKYNLKPEAQAILKAGAPAYLKYTDYNLVVEGHCDERGTVEYNLALGEKRAMEAAKYLVDLGIEKERIKTISYGEEKPVDREHIEEAWAKNRRAHFFVTPPVK